jgi:hypothetical protein
VPVRGMETEPHGINPTRMLTLSAACRRCGSPAEAFTRICAPPVSHSGS